MKKKVLLASITASVLGLSALPAFAKSLLIHNSTDKTIAAVWYRDANDNLRQVGGFIRPGSSRYVNVSCGWGRFQFDDINNNEMTFRPEYPDVCNVESIEIY